MSLRWNNLQVYGIQILHKGFYYMCGLAESGQDNPLRPYASSKSAVDNRQSLHRLAHLATRRLCLVGAGLASYSYLNRHSPTRKKITPNPSRTRMLGKMSTTPAP